VIWSYEKVEFSRSEDTVTVSCCGFLSKGLLLFKIVHLDGLKTIAKGKQGREVHGRRMDVRGGRGMQRKRCVDEVRRSEMLGREMRGSEKAGGNNKVLSKLLAVKQDFLFWGKKRVLVLSVEA
jgi:hypothetical protein